MPVDEEDRTTCDELRVDDGDLSILWCEKLVGHKENWQRPGKGELGAESVRYGGFAIQMAERLVSGEGDGPDDGE